MRGTSCAKSRDVGQWQSCFSPFSPALFVQKEFTCDDIVSLVLIQENKEVSDVSVTIRHDRMRVSPSLHGELHRSKEAPASSKATCPPTQIPPHSLSTGQREKSHVVGWHKMFGKAQQLPISTHVHSTSEWRRWLDVTPWLLIFASDLRGGMCDEQLVLLHRQISTDPHGTCIGKMVTVETWLKGLKSGFSFGLETENYGLHYIDQCRQKLFREDPGSHPTRWPRLKHCKEEWILSILTAPPSDPADASVIVKVPPNWVKLPSFT